MKENNKIKLGAFLLISVVLLVSSFMAAGIGKMLKPKLKAMTLLDTSVEGMMIGSPVKYLGMTVGKITGLTMRGQSTQIAVYFELFPEMVEDDQANETSNGKFDREDLEKLVKLDVLHCFVNAAGLMGGTFLELEVNEIPAKKTTLPAKQPPVRVPHGFTYIPARPSHIGNAIQNVSRLLEDLKAVDIRRSADRIDKLLDNLDRVLNRGELDRTMAMLNRVCGNMEQLSERLIVALNDENMARFQKMISNLEVTCVHLEEFSSKSNLVELTGNVNLFFREAQRLLKDLERGDGRIGILCTRLEQSLVRLDNALQELNSTASSIQDDPSQFVRGKNPEAW